MPTVFSCYVRRPPTCHKPYTWSTFRGGCRFRPGHKGECKPRKR